MPQSPPKKCWALVGNPNAGKTALFNVLTGASERVGNWSGVTVDMKKGQVNGHHIELYDLPGVYGLTQSGKDMPLDETATFHFLTHHAYHGVVNVVDVTQLSRQLYLTCQLIERGFSVVLALTHCDQLSKSAQTAVVAHLQQQLGIQVIKVNNHHPNGQALKPLLTQLESPNHCRRPAWKTPPYFPRCLAAAYQSMQHRHDKSTLMDVLEQGALPTDWPAHWYAEYEQQMLHWQQQLNGPTDVALAMARYHFIEDIVKTVTQPLSPLSRWVPISSETWDRWVLHRWLGLPIFFLMMYLLFFVAIEVGGIFQPAIEILSQAIFVDGLSCLLSYLPVPMSFVQPIGLGVGLGITTTLSFIPVLGCMFFALGFLEESGYMARAAFVMDRLMRYLGLPGQSFVPLIIGFGCNVPAIAASRTLNNLRDRLLTVLMTPFMSCGARLAIFTVFVSAFFPQHGPQVIFLLYCIGMLMAVLTGLLLKRWLLNQEISPLVLELPTYKRPALKRLCRQSARRLKRFLSRAIRIIVPVTVLLTVLLQVPMPQHSDESILSWSAQKISPVFAPMGITEDNWPATMGLLTGILAKEVTVGTLNALYSEPEVAATVALAPWTLPLNEAWESIQNGVMALFFKVERLESGLAFGELQSRFVTPAAAMAYLLFILLYLPCISTIGAMIREVGREWAIFSVIWTTVLAYTVASTFYQLSLIWITPWISLSWIGGLVGLQLLLLWRFRAHCLKVRRALVPTRIRIVR